MSFLAGRFTAPGMVVVRRVLALALLAVGVLASAPAGTSGTRLAGCGATVAGPKVVKQESRWGGASLTLRLKYPVTAAEFMTITAHARFPGVNGSHIARHQMEVRNGRSFLPNPNETHSHVLLIEESLPGRSHRATRVVVTVKLAGANDGYGPDVCRQTLTKTILLR